jgi:hypothetical protein
MADAEALPVPQEIAWKLIASNQVLSLGEPGDATISIFYYEPEMDSLDREYPDERLVYLKFTLTAAPPFIDSSTLGTIGARFLGGTVPVRHLMFDVGVTPDPLTLGGIRPYFHSASPLRRTMVESGVIGRQIAEREADSVALGSSGSQLLDTISSHTPSGVEREDIHSLEEYRQVTNREASQERRELLSHITHVDNVLTLLSVKHLGSPYLRFNLWPRPITSLLGDESDLERWYQELLRRRSSGIEGIQEFIAVVVVRRDAGFCLQTRMRRICVLDAPPADPKLGREPLVFDTTQVNRILGHLYRTYPRGTSIEELDVNLWPQINAKYGDEAKQFVRPAVSGWGHQHVLFNNRSHQDARCFFRVPYNQTNLNPFRSILYKTMHEVWLEMRRAEYQDALLRSPLERGIVLTFDAALNACVEATFRPRRVTHSAAVGAIVSFKPNRHDAKVGSFVEAGEPRAVDSWDDLDEQLRVHLNSAATASAPLSLDDPRLVQLLLNRLATLEVGDPRNHSLQEAAELLSLDAASIRELDAAGACDFRSFAELLMAAQQAPDECSALRETRAREKLMQLDSGDAICVTSDEPEEPAEMPEWPISAAGIDKILDRIGAALKRRENSKESPDQGKK